MALKALTPTGLQTVLTFLKSKFDQKADLVNGVVPITQLPAISGGFEPTIIPCTLDYANATPDDSMTTWSVQLTTESYTSATSAAEAGTPAILKITMQYTETDETTGESTTVILGTLDILLFAAVAGDSVSGMAWIDKQAFLFVELSSTGLLHVGIGDNSSSSASDYEINISCTAQQLLGGSFTVSLGSGTYSDAMSAAQDGRGVTAVFTVESGYLTSKIPMQLMQPPQDDGNGGYTTGYGYGSMTVRAAFTGSEAIWNVAVKIDSNDTATVTTTNMSAANELPPVTSEDAGKFAQVDSTGAWTAVAIPYATGVGF